MALVEAGVDVVVIDTAHGHYVAGRQGRRARIKRETNRVQIVAGNVATYDGARALIDAGRRRGEGRASARARSAPPASSPAWACRS